MYGHLYYSFGRQNDVSSLTSSANELNILYATAAHIGPSISVVRPSLLAILGTNVDHWYARVCRTPDLEIVFLSDVIAENSM